MKKILADNEPRPPEMATLGLSKVFILDKYFTELQKFWETEKKLQGTPLGIALDRPFRFERVESCFHGRCTI